MRDGLRADGGQQPGRTERVSDKIDSWAWWDTLAYMLKWPTYLFAIGMVGLGVWFALQSSIGGFLLFTMAGVMAILQYQKIVLTAAEKEREIEEHTYAW